MTETAVVKTVAGAVSLASFQVDVADIKAMEGAGTGVEAKVEFPKIAIFHSTPAQDSEHPNGTWLFGMKKFTEGADVGRIEVQGIKVLAMTILSARKQYNYYNDKDIKNACSSNFFIDFSEDIFGSKHKVRCGKKNGCPKAGLDDRTRCKCQIVLAGIAHLENGENIDCKYYAKGSAYSNTQDLLKKGFTLPVGEGGKMATLECFMAPVQLLVGPAKMNGNVLFHEPEFEITSVHPKEAWTDLRAKAIKAGQYFDTINSITSGAPEAAQAAVQAPPQAAVQAPLQAAGAAATNVVNNQTGAGTPAKELKNVTPSEGATADETADLAAQMGNILGS